MEDYSDLHKWFGLGKNITHVAETFYAVSSGDSRKLSSRAWRSSTSIWSKISLQIFEEDSLRNRFWFFNIWNDNVRGVQEEYNRLCGKKIKHSTPIRQTEKAELYCFCEKQYRESDDPSFIECTSCSRWFHFICIGEEPRRSDSAAFECPVCLGKNIVPPILNLTDADISSICLVDITGNPVEGSKEAESPSANPILEDAITEKAKLRRDSAATDSSEEIEELEEETIGDLDEFFQPPLVSSPVEAQDDIFGEDSEVRELGQGYRDTGDVPLTFDFIIPRTDWDSFHLRSTTGKDNAYIIKSNYTDIIAQHFVTHNKHCVLSFTKKILLSKTKSGAYFKAYANCKHDKCQATYSFSLEKKPAHGQDAHFSARRSGNVIHEIESVKTRWLKGETRDEAKKQLQIMKPSAYRRALFADADSSVIDTGHYTPVNFLRSLQVASHEANRENDYHRDRLVDLIMTKLKSESQLPGKHVNGFIQKIGLYPFFVLAFCEAQMQIHKRMTDLEPELVGLLDATAGIVDGLPHPFETKTPLLFSLVIRAYKRGDPPLQVMEFLSTDETHSGIAFCLHSYFETYRQAFGRNKRFYGLKRMEIDFSKTLLTALILVFQGVDNVTYFENLWLANIGSLTPKQLDKLFPIHVCRVHAVRFLREAVRDCYKNKSKTAEPTTLWEKWIQAFIRGKDMFHYHRRVTDVFVISGSYFYTTKCRELVENISQPSNREGVQLWANFVPAADRNDHFWLRSPFGEYAARIADSVTEENKKAVLLEGKSLSVPERVPNPYYNPDFFHYMKVYIFPYTPILNHSVFRTFNLVVKDDTTNVIENYHKILKKDLIPKKLGAHANYPPGRFYRLQQICVIGGCKQFQSTLPPERKPRGVRIGHHDSTDDDQDDALGTDAFAPGSVEIEIDADTDDTANIGLLYNPASIQKTNPATSKKNLSPEDEVERFKKIKRREKPSLPAPVLLTLNRIPWGGESKIRHRAV